MIDNCVRYRDLIIVCLFAEPFKMEEHQGKPCHNDSSNSKPLDFGDYMSTASTISSANSDNEEQEDIGKDSGGNSKVFSDFSDSEYDSESEDICKTTF